MSGHLNLRSSSTSTQAADRALTRTLPPRTWNQRCCFGFFNKRRSLIDLFIETAPKNKYEPRRCPVGLVSSASLACDADCEFLATFAAAIAQNLAATRGRHALEETMNALTFATAGLVRSFHM